MTVRNTDSTRYLLHVDGRPVGPLRQKVEHAYADAVASGHGFYTGEDTVSLKRGAHIECVR